MAFIVKQLQIFWQKCSLSRPLPGKMILLSSVNFFSYLLLAKFRVQVITALMVWNIFMKILKYT